MPFGEPRSVEGKCNARLHIGDNYGDNHATMLCGLEPGHPGLHQEIWATSHSGTVTITWEHEDPMIALEELDREIEKSIEAAHPKASPDFEWIEELEMSATKYTVGEKTVYYRLDALHKVWVYLGDIKNPPQEMLKAEAIQALIDGLKP
jgi:hypothetical protein